MPLGEFHFEQLPLNHKDDFAPGAASPVFTAGGLTFGVNICHDTAFPETAAALARQGADLIVCPANNMIGHDKAEEYKELHNAERAKRCVETGMWLVSSDVTGAQDGRISYGPTAFINPRRSRRVPGFLG